MTTYQPSQTFESGVEEPTGWTGWSAFAAVMLFLAGGFGIIAGFVALFRDTVYLATKNQMIVSVDYTAWGWAHLIVGTLLIVAAASLLQGHMYGRIVAVIVASISALVNLAFLPAYPIWCTIIIAVDVLVIYAVTAHGRELQY